MKACKWVWDKLDPQSNFEKVEAYAAIIGATFNVGGLLLFCLTNLGNMELLP